MFRDSGWAAAVGPKGVGIMTRRSEAAPGLALAWAFLAASASGQTTRAHPRLPDAAGVPPREAVANAPFSVAKLFAAPAPERNAAPLYLDALVEFGPGMVDTLRPGPQRDALRKAVADREERLIKVYEVLDKDGPTSVPTVDIDAALAPFRDGFQ